MAEQARGPRYALDGGSPRRSARGVLRLPFGGVEDSRYGRMSGRALMRELTDLGWITVQSGPQAFSF